MKFGLNSNFPLFSDVQKRQADKKQTLHDKNPLELLNDIVEGVKYFFVNYPNGGIECLAKVHGQCFSGRGSSQHTARLQSIKQILLNIFNINLDEPQASQTSAISRQNSIQSSIRTNHKFGDEIER